MGACQLGVSCVVRVAHRGAVLFAVLVAVVRAVLVQHLVSANGDAGLVAVRVTVPRAVLVAVHAFVLVAVLALMLVAVVAAVVVIVHAVSSLRCVCRIAQHAQYQRHDTSP